MNDDQLIKEAIAGNREALTMLVEIYKDISFNIALSIVRDREDAKDIVQESFIRVLKNIEHFRNRSAFSTWLYRIVYNESLRHLEKLKRRLMLDVREYKSVYSFDDDDQMHDTRYTAVLEQIEKLTDKERHLIMFFYLGEKSIKEIQEITGMTSSNIKVNLHRIRKKLSENLNIPL
jgi:RNA polymerase sigma-70 factor (ECF subfamily)